MKENEKEEESFHSSSKNLLNKLNTVKTEKYIELEEKNPTSNKDKAVKGKVRHLSIKLY